ncbi:hypothetical protein [Geofilum rubicundum]|nr:hypothetical protein [Geofilum rubicundum]
MKRILLAFVWILISLPMLAQLKSVPLVPESFARVYSGPVVTNANGLRMNTVGRRNGNTLLLKDGFNVVGQDVYIKWFLKSNSYIRGSFSLLPITAQPSTFNSGQLDAYPKNEWLYTRIVVNADYSFAFVTARNNYDNQGGSPVDGTTVSGTVPEESRHALTNSSLKIDIADTYDTGAYMDIAELLIPEDTEWQYREADIWDFEVGIPAPISFTGTGTCQITSTDVFGGSGALEVVANDGDVMQFDIPAEVDFMTFRVKISHGTTKMAQLKLDGIFQNYLSIYTNGSTSYAEEWCEVALPISGDGTPTQFSLEFALGHTSQLVLMDDVRFYSKDIPKSQLNLDNGDIQEKSPVGTHVGDFFGTESEGRDLSILTHGLESPDKDFFTMDGSALKTAEVLNSDEHNNFSLDVVAEVSGVLPLLYHSFDINVLPEFAGGDGSSLSPYQIANPRHLNNVRNYLALPIKACILNW